MELESCALTDLGSVGALRKHIRTLEPQSSAVDFAAPERAPHVVLEVASQASAVVDEGAESLWESTVEILSAESGIADVDLSDGTIFSDIGIDSLLSLVICSRMRDELGIDISERAFYSDLPTVGALRKYVTGAQSPQEIPPDLASSIESPTAFWSSSNTPEADTPPSEVTTPMSEADEVTPTIDAVLRRGLERNDSLFHSRMDPRVPEIKPAWSITLQGSAKKSSQRLFLFPDGCGAATSYLRLPNIGKDVAVIGFNSPYMKRPKEMRDVPLQNILNAYMQALRKHQPHGPYHLGGWSAGGILAYAAAQELMAAGEEVTTMLLIDSPDPSHGLDRLPQRFFEHCTKVGIFGSELTETRTVPPWLIPHFEATIDLLHDYCPSPMPKKGSMPSVHIIWAAECALDGVRYARMPAETMDDRDTAGMKFLTERRTDFGPGGWADLFPGANITVEVAEGEHHFSMMRNDGADRLANFIRKALDV